MKISASVKQQYNSIKMTSIPLKINEVKVKSIFTKSGLPGSDWVINPYNGCPFACMYCYAAQIARWKHPDEEWGTFLDVKINAPELLKAELNKLYKKLNTKNFGSVFFSSVTDPYNGAEAKYKLTRKCLEVLADFGYEGAVSIQTKSPLVTQDIYILKELKNAMVGFTITTLEDKVSRFLEVKAPAVSARLKALQLLRNNGIQTYAFVGPILPYFTTNASKINGILDKLQEVGVKEVWFEHINLSPKIRARLFNYLREKSPDLIPDFEYVNAQEYRDNLDRFITKAVNDRRMVLGLNKVIHHGKLPKKFEGVSKNR